MPLSNDIIIEQTNSCMLIGSHLLNAVGHRCNLVDCIHGSRLSFVSKLTHSVPSHYFLSEHISHPLLTYDNFPANGTLLYSAAMQSHVNSNSIISSTSDTFPPPNRRLRIFFRANAHLPQRFIWLSAKILLDYVAQANCTRCFHRHHHYESEKRKTNFTCIGDDKYVRLRCSPTHHMHV